MDSETNNGSYFQGVFDPLEGQDGRYRHTLLEILKGRESVSDFGFQQAGTTMAPDVTLGSDKQLEEH